jgi:hypothetical protein
MKRICKFVTQLDLEPHSFRVPSQISIIVLYFLIHVVLHSRALKYRIRTFSYERDSFFDMTNPPNADNSCLNDSVDETTEHKFP